VVGHRRQRLEHRPIVPSGNNGSGSGV
jgi:hypothetical protein